ncbi:MAG TPA: family 1 glycosylhydrolase [Acidimicrobiales bacterium]|nr:family 1 glycosylhydrolase [Acidimicrobiales bacterium]
MASETGTGLLPEGFLLGVATAGFQVEGGFNDEGEPANNWADWELSGRVDRSGDACGFWREPETALDRAATLGCNAFRLSVEWARIEPEDGVVDDVALGRYVGILAACHERGLEPIVTLHHFTHPWWLGEEFWLMPGSPDRFVAHVARILPALTEHCRHWVTVNEPNIVALSGWIDGSCPPGRRLAVSDAVEVLDNLLTAHVLAYEAIHTVQPQAIVTVNPSTSTIYEHDRLLTDLLWARHAGIGREKLDDWIAERRALHDLAAPAGNAAELAIRRLFAAVSPFGSALEPDDSVGRSLVAGLRRRARRQSARRVVDALYASRYERPIDASGLDWYDPVPSRALRLPGQLTSGGRSWSPGRALWDVPPHPEGLTAWCHAEQALLPGLPMLVVENGMATRVRGGVAYRRLDGWDRVRYLREHLRAIVDALDAGVPVQGYLHWSLVDNYEWGTYEPRFGIFGMDRTRSPVRWLPTDADGRDAAGAFARLARGLAEGDRSVLTEPF